MKVSLFKTYGLESQAGPALLCILSGTHTIITCLQHRKKYYDGLDFNYNHKHATKIYLY